MDLDDLKFYLKILVQHSKDMQRLEEERADLKGFRNLFFSKLKLLRCFLVKFFVIELK